MNDEIKEILSNDNIHIIECDKNWCNAYGYEKSQLKEDLLDYLTNLEQKVEQYENPDDYTLFYMWLDAKAKDKIKQLQQENERLKENAIHNDKVVDKARWNEMIYKSRCEKLEEYINTHKVSDTISFPLMKKEEENQVKSCFDYEFEQIYKKELLNILNGGDEE